MHQAGKIPSFRGEGCQGIPRKEAFCMTTSSVAGMMIGNQLEHEGPARGKEISCMARKAKRPYGSGCLMKVGKSWAIRWRETEQGHDGAKKRILRYETLGRISSRQATQILNERLAVASRHIRPARMVFSELAEAWKASILPMYKQSTRRMHLYILEQNLLPAFGNVDLSGIRRQDVQMFIAQLTQAGYAPNSVDHIHNVLSAVLGTAVKWGHLKENPARGVCLPKLVPVRPRWVLTAEQANRLLRELPVMPRTMVGLAILTGVRRGELLALRWGSLDEEARCLNITEAVYDGVFDTPKTPASKRKLPVSSTLFELLMEWKRRSKRTAPADLMFGTSSGKPVSPNNVMRRFVVPVCDRLGLPRASWLTFRRTFSSWSHEKGVPGKVVAELMGHSNVQTTLNVYTQVMQDSLRVAAEKVGTELFSIVQFSTEKDVSGKLANARNYVQ